MRSNFSVVAIAVFAAGFSIGMARVGMGARTSADISRTRTIPRKGAFSSTRKLAARGVLAIISPCFTQNSGTVGLREDDTLDWILDGNFYAAGTGISPCDAYSECRSYVMSGKQLIVTDKPCDISSGALVTGHGNCPAPAFNLSLDQNNNLVLSTPVTCSDGYSTVLTDVSKRRSVHE